MTTEAPYRADWPDRAACAGEDTSLWFSKNPAAAVEICGRCPVRPECLYDAVRREGETAFGRYGIWGGLTVRERMALPDLPAEPVNAIATLRELLAALDERDSTPDERTDQPMTATPPTDTAAAPAPAAELVTTSKLLRWAEGHPDPAVQDQGAQAEAALTGLRQRYAADLELTAITTEAEQLEKRLAELQARKAELAPAKPKKKRGAYVRDHEPREVRAWADANGVDCPRVGQIPKRVLDAWRAAQSKETADA